MSVFLLFRIIVICRYVLYDIVIVVYAYIHTYIQLCIYVHFYVYIFSAELWHYSRTTYSHMYIEIIQLYA